MSEHFSGQTNKEAWRLRRRFLYLYWIVSIAVILFWGNMDKTSGFHELAMESILYVGGFMTLAWFIGPSFEDTISKVKGTAKNAMAKDSD